MPSTDLLLMQPDHRRALERDAARLFEFFRASLGTGPGFHTLGDDGTPLSDTVQELHTTTRLVHSYALGAMAGLPGAQEIVDQGMDYLWHHHRDTVHGGYVWSCDGEDIADGTKLAYGHVFVLLAASSAMMAGHADARRLFDDIAEVLETRFWDDDHGLFSDEYTRDWTPFSTYRGMNANMHGVEALLAAFEATGETVFLERAGRILDFFMHRVAPAHEWRLPEHYTEHWEPDLAYAGNPMFRPAGTTPGHSFEMARLTLHHWDLGGRQDDRAPVAARAVLDRALTDAWDETRGGIVYTLGHDGAPDSTARYWWPVTEALAALAMFLKLEALAEDDACYRRLYAFADAHFIDHENGGWFPEIDDTGRPTATQFKGKPDIYHALQADLFALSDGLSRHAESLPSLTQ